MIARALGTMVFAISPLVWAWQPDPRAADGFSVDASSRRVVLAFFNRSYRASEEFQSRIDWTGNLATGAAGTTSLAFKEDVRRRINFYRALCGLPADVTFDQAFSAKAQQAALMFSANSSISHSPPTDWIWYSAEGAEAAANSNIALGNFGPDAIDAYIADEGAHNRVVGHRRWILFSRASVMGTGDVPPTALGPASNSLWVMGSAPAGRPPRFVGWPNEGFCPADLIPARWSLSFPQANFAAATVAMTMNGENLPLSIVSRTDNGYGENTLVWEPASLPLTSTITDTHFQVTVSGITGSGIPGSKSYPVTAFNPNILGESIGLVTDGTTAVGEAIAFNQIELADAYELEITRTISQPWVDGAEDSAELTIETETSAGYEVRQGELVRSGAKAFQLTYPPGIFSPQAFVLNRDILPTANSRLEYFDRARFSSVATQLTTQISTDNGASWTAVASRNGVNSSGSSAEWDAEWIPRSIDLASYAGEIVKLRFVITRNGPIFQGIGPEFGFFIDDVTVTNSAYLSAAITTTYQADDSAVVLDELTAGEIPAIGSTYNLRVRPQVGTRWFPFGPLHSVIVREQSVFPTYLAWAATFEGGEIEPGTIANDPAGDFDRDGKPNLAEFAFGESPIVAGNGGRFPVAVGIPGRIGLSYQINSQQQGISVSPEFSTDLLNWSVPGAPDAPAGFRDVVIRTDGPIETREATVPEGETGFLRVRISLN